MNKSIKIICVFAVMTIITVVSCTDLSETLYSEIESSKFYQT